MSARAAWRLEALGYRPVYRYAPGKQDWLANGLPIEGREASLPRIAELAVDLPTCRIDEPLGEVRKRMQQAEADVCAVINDRRVVVGVLRGAVLEAPSETRVEAIMDPGPATYRLDVTVAEMAQHMQQTGARRVLVTTSDGELVGLLRQEEVEQAAHEAHGAHAAH